MQAAGINADKSCLKMVFLEMAAVILKASSAAASSLSGASALLPHHIHADAIESASAAMSSAASSSTTLQLLLSDVMGSAINNIHENMSSISLVKLATECMVPSFVAFGVQGLLKSYGFFPASDDDATDELEDTPKVARLRTLSAALRLCVFNDTFLLTCVLQSWGVQMPIPLRTWVLGGLIFSFPCTWFVDRVAKRDGFKVAFIVERVQLGAAGIWFVWGTDLLSTPGAAEAAPLLWCAGFLDAVFSGSFLATGAVMILLAACHKRRVGSVPLTPA